MKNEDEKAIISSYNGDMDGWMRDKYNWVLWTLG